VRLSTFKHSNKLVLLHPRSGMHTSTAVSSLPSVCIPVALQSDKNNRCLRVACKSLLVVVAVSYIIWQVCFLIVGSHLEQGYTRTGLAFLQTSSESIPLCCNMEHACYLSILKVVDVHHLCGHGALLSQFILVFDFVYILQKNCHYTSLDYTGRLRM
jgi:hypothetical protein